MLLDNETMASGTTQLDNEIFWRIIRALELVTKIESEMREMRAVSALEVKQLQKEMGECKAQLVAEVNELRELWEKKQQKEDEHATAIVTGRYSVKVALIQSIPAALAGALTYLVTKWVGG